MILVSHTKDVHWNIRRTHTVCTIIWRIKCNRTFHFIEYLFLEDLPNHWNCSKTLLADSLMSYPGQKLYIFIWASNWYYLILLKNLTLISKYKFPEFSLILHFFSHFPWFSLHFPDSTQKACFFSGFPVFPSFVWALLDQYRQKLLSFFKKIFL